MDTSNANKEELYRIAALQECGILDSEPEPQFDELTKLASLVCDTPMALISLVDSKRQWFKSKIGVGAPETPREYAFCHYAIQGNDLFEVVDALADNRFKTNPLVLGEPHIRYYAGVPLETRHQARIGTLCVLDTKPRKLSDLQKKELRLLANQVVRQIEMKRQSDIMADQAETLVDASLKYKELLSSLEQQKVALDAHALVTIADAKGRIIYANPKFCKITQYSLSELIGQDHRILNSGFHPPEFFKEMYDAILKGETWHGELKNKAKDGSLHWVSTTIVPRRDVNGDIVQYLSIRTDITKRKKAERELDLFLNTATDIRCTVSLAGQFRFVNPSFADLLGYRKEELINQPFISFVHPLDQEASINGLEKVIKGEVVLDFENRYRCKDGSWKIISWRGRQEDDGLIYATGRDVTEQRRVSIELKDSERLLATTLSSINEAVITVDFNSSIIRINEAAERFLGWSVKDTAGRPLDDILQLVEEDQGNGVDLPLGDVIQTGRPYENSNSLVLFSRSGAKIAVDVFSKALRNDQGKVMGAVLVIRDVSEARQQRKTIKRQSQLLSDLRSVQDKFIKEPAKIDAYEALLQVLLKFTASEYGFVGEVLYDESSQPYLKTHALTNIAWTEELKKFYADNAPRGLEFRNLKTLFGSVMTSGQPVISNSPSNDPRRGGLPDGHPPLNAFLGLPIYNDNQMVGMIGAANRSGGYDQKLIEEMQPLLTTYANLILARRTLLSQRQAEKRAEEQTILLAQKQNLLQEVHHRVKNNLQIISSLLALQQNQESSPELVEQLRSSRSRIAAVGLLHEILYRTESMESLDLSLFLRELVRRLKDAFGTSAAHIRFHVESPSNVSLRQEQAASVALIINELVTNSIKHAFPGNRPGCISVIAQLENGNQSRLEIMVVDDGVGLPATNHTESNSKLGSQIVRRLAAQLNGKINFENVEKGTKWKLVFQPQQ